MGFTEQAFPAGTHMCFIYSDDAERRSLIAKFLAAGFTSGEKVGYFADSATPEEVRMWLAAKGLEIPDDKWMRQFSVLDAATTYCPKGKFVPDTMLDALRAYYEQAMEEGHPGVRVSGEMTWALRGIPGSQRLMEYEALVNTVLATHPVTAICQYDANLFDGGTILDVLRVHPMMVVHGQILENPYYVKPDEFLCSFAGQGGPSERS
jgi:hypothetical protein